MLRSSLDFTIKSVRPNADTIKKTFDIYLSLWYTFLIYRTSVSKPNALVLGCSSGNQDLYC